MMLSMVGCGSTTATTTTTSDDSADVVVADDTATEDDAVAEEGDSEADDTATEVLSDGTYYATSDNVKTLGRTYYDNVDNILWCALSGTGAEFTFTGTKCEVEVKGDAVCMTGSDDTKARVAIYVNGERVIDDMVNESTETYTVFESDTEEEVTVRVIKLSESAQSCMGIKSISVEGSAIEATEEKDLLIEFIGDSITCAYGVDDEDRDHHFSTETEDITKSYAYKTAEALDADYSMVCYSGYGVLSGYTSDGSLNTAQLVPTYYEKVGFSYGSFSGTAPSDIEWSFERQADVIVINLGTNDANYTTDEDKKMEYVDAYIEFIKQIRESNPDAEIICALGTMGTGLCMYLEYAVEVYVEETGDEHVYYLGLDSQSADDGYAADWHPTEATHEKAAAVVAAKIQEILG